LAEARDPIALVYSWFTEAFALADLEERHGAARRLRATDARPGAGQRVTALRRCSGFNLLGDGSWYRCSDASLATHDGGTLRQQLPVQANRGP